MWNMQLIYSYIIIIIIIIIIVLSIPFLCIISSIFIMETVVFVFPIFQ